MHKIIEIENYKDYGKCLSISNDTIEALVTLDVGPRIIYFGFKNCENVLFDQRDMFEPMGGEAFDTHYFKGAAWENLGGHRLWIAPESLPETYNPDINPVSYEICENSVVFIQAPQTQNGIQIKLQITIDEEKPELTVKHIGINISNEDKVFSLWPITVMAQSGIEIIPLNTDDNGLLPNRNITLWSYTKINDPRLNITDKYLILKQDPNNPDAFKIGVDCNKGVGYYILEDTVFSKMYEHVLNANYPDFSASYESYTNDTILEFETLSPLSTVKPNQEIEHTEKFVLYRKPCELDISNENKIKEFINKLTSEK